MAKISICWIEDSSNTLSCHRNEKGLTFKESYLGNLHHQDGKWWFKLNGDETLHGPHDDSSKARKALKRSVNGEEVDEWYAGDGWKS